MAPLSPDLRTALKNAVVNARETAEAGAANAMAVLAVEEERAPATLSTADRDLRVQLRARSRSLGNGLTFEGIPELREEIAYAAWHRMLFARFLAENGLLVEPASRVPVSMEDVAEIAREQREPDPWALASRYAAEMLPGIFGTAEPTTQVIFAPDDRQKLERILRDLPAELFTADDAMGWVYQFWQSKRKDEVNASGKRVGGADLAPVTQLFTEHYMVRFLLENSLGAWWAVRHPESQLLAELAFLRRREDGLPAAGTFEGWPESAAEITVMDPCMGSGHFLVAAADMLRKMRMEEEGITAQQAAEAVITDNLFGLELDPRCTQIGAFAVAFDAWKAAGSYCPLPLPNIACSGIAVKGELDDWRRLAGEDDRLRAGLERLYELFRDAPELGSLIDPRAAAGEGLWAVDPDALVAALDRALARETEDPTAAVFGADARGAAKAARLLTGSYWLVATNPPFLGDAKQSQVVRSHVAARWPEATSDLAVALMMRATAGLHAAGSLAIVLPTSWTSQPRYELSRRAVLASEEVDLVCRLGSRAFGAVSGEVVNVVLIVATHRWPRDASVAFIDASDLRDPSSKSEALRQRVVAYAMQESIRRGPGARIFVADAASSLGTIGDVAFTPQGIKTGDDERFIRRFWEVVSSRWRRLQTTVVTTIDFGGRHLVVDWGAGGRDMIRPRLDSPALGQVGVAVSLMGSLPVTLYQGDRFDSNVTPVVPRDPNAAAALWAYAASSEFAVAARQLEPGMKINTGTLSLIPFDEERWARVAAEQYPDGLPEPRTDDPTQWLFKGNVVGSQAPLQVAVARLVGYRWPDQEPDDLDPLADPDGIVCLPAVGEAPAAERLDRLLAAAYGAEWSARKREELLRLAGGKATTLGSWLRDEFFEQHARLFGNRPFVWQIWDGRRDGFSAILHYHRLDREALAKVAYAQLGEWLERQRAGVRAGEPGADSRLKAAQDLQTKLAAILEGQPPYDIYVRWKPLADQPIGWDPDLDDGVRANIRPFVAAGVLRAKFTVNWNKDRGTDPGGSERINDRHFTAAEKRAAIGASS